MTEQSNRVPLDEAEYPDLKAYAEILGIEVKQGTNSTQLRAKVKACQPDCADIPRVIVAQAEPEFEPPSGYVPVEGEDPSKRPAAISMPASKSLLRHMDDPRVTLRISKTDDKRRAKDVFVQVNGVTLGIQRGVVVELPYRFYLALLNAKESAAVDSDEINPLTGQPIKVWEEVQSYEFQVSKLPSEEEVEEWTRRTADGFQGPGATRQPIAA